MRTVPFREVLHGVAYKMGLDPDQSNFLTNQAIPIGTYIDEWVRRTYDARDWPEWVVTHKFTPASHIVTWDARSSDFASAQEPLGKLLQLGRVYKVFLVDPATTSAPVDTPFTLRDNGIHVGFEHGTSVWIRFMVPPPRYTAVQWAGDTTFQKDDVTYSYTTGQVYKSKSNGNIGHNPATTFSVPPVPHVIEPHPPPPSPDITTTQERTADNVGLAERNQILVLSLVDAFTGVTPDDPPEVGTDFIVQVYDTATDTLLASVLYTANGTESIDDVVTGLDALLVAEPNLSTYTITKAPGPGQLTLENASLFSTPASSYAVPSEGGPNHVMKSVVTQTYVPAFAAASGQPQITRIAMTDERTLLGATYTMTVTGSDGVEHAVEYESSLYDSSSQILNGLVLAAEADSDEFWSTVQFGFDADAATLDVAVRDTFSVDLLAPPPGGGFWELVPFPAALADQVMTGALGDLLFEWGQTDKAGAEDQKVPLEAQVSESKFTTVPTPMLTGQEAPLSRYKVQ